MTVAEQPPPILTDLAEQLGYFIAQRLVEHYGGTRVYIPHPERLPPDHPVAVRIGHPIALRLARVYGGRALQVPLAVHELRTARNRSILDCKKSGQSLAEIARRHRVTERTVCRVLAQAGSGGSADRCQL